MNAGSDQKIRFALEIGNRTMWFDEYGSAYDVMKYYQKYIYPNEKARIYSINQITFVDEINTEEHDPDFEW